MSKPDRLSAAIDVLRTVSTKEIARLDALQSPSSEGVHEAIFCDAMVQHAIAEATQSYLLSGTVQSHRYLCALLNALLRRTVRALRDDQSSSFSSEALARAAMGSIIALGVACDTGATADSAVP